jgi:uncharacterized protein DUF4058
MASPFPGMDPYLEHPRQWESFHARLVIHIADLLQPLVAPRYLVRPQERAAIVFEERPIVPDVSVTLSRGERERAGVAVLAASAPVVVYGVEVEHRQTYLQILDRNGRQVVTVLELLSPSNKRSGPGNRLYMQKQAEVLDSAAHLVEIDLLRAGSHTVAVPDGLLAPYRPYHYLACVNRSSERGRFDCYPFRIREPIPIIPIPLLDGDADAVLDLRSALDRAYEAGYYSIDLDYQAEPEPPLSPEDAAWADALLREAGFRR